ncbi:helix-turn-helix domain-containing protein [Chryseobacterium rhizosphaerae]|uniref:helix-turn-helix domain-containing protein n=1 Tax=Chryseobacterium rhizosphaerae TaxID=395937 RepID=UPI0023586A64|nr:helix-turn-helix domain-containing protein [Chryseobacterium rhizosphaerae]MDC8099468.1 helix-turn-helix domain-containing protein [Chryseobacterium rhizosphaerae]
MKKAVSVNYQKIYKDLIMKKFPEKMQEYDSFLLKDEFTGLDVIKINNLIFGDQSGSVQKLNQKLRSYNKHTILKIMDYQKRYKLNNSQLALHFNMSRNTIAKWKKQFVIK